MVGSFADRVTIPADVLIQEMPGEAVLLDLRSERYFGLDEVGVSVWRTLHETGSLQTAYDRLLAEYEVEPEQLRADLNQLVRALVENGLLEVHSE